MRLGYLWQVNVLNETTKVKLIQFINSKNPKKNYFYSEIIIISENPILISHLASCNNNEMTQIGRYESKRY